MDPTLETPVWLIFVIYFLMAICYMIPTWIAFWKKLPARWYLAVANLFLGVTGFIWCILLVYVCSTNTEV